MKINNHIKHKQRFTVNLSREVKYNLRAAKKNPIYQKIRRRRVSMQKAMKVITQENYSKGYLAWLAFLARNKVI